jgi:beta-galactosidase
MNAGSAAHLAIETPLAAATNKGSDTFAVATGGDGGVALDILVENLGRVTGNPIGMDFTFRGIRRWVNVAGQQLANWTIAPLPLSNVSALGQSFRWRKSAASTAKDGIPRFYRGRFSVLPGELADTFVTLPGWGKGQIFVNGHNVQRYWSSLGPQYSFYCPAQWLVEGENELVLFETSRAAANFTVSLRANHTIVR